MEIDPIAALGRAWGERELHDLLAAFGIKAKSLPKPNDFTAFLQNRALGVELTFRRADALDVPLRGDLSPETLVLSSVRLYGPGSSTHKAFKGALPFGLRFGDTKEALIAKFGPPDRDRPNRTHFAPMRWDTERYAFFVKLDDGDRLKDLSLQLPVVASKRPGFEAR